MQDSERFEPALPGKPGLSLALLAGVTLFLELAFIRWASANVIYLGYFTNFVLMACFLGIGIGFLVSRRKVDLLPWAAPVLGFVCFSIYVLQTSITLSQEGIEGRVYFNTGAVLNSVAPVWLTMSILFVGIAAVFVCISQATGRCFPYFHPIKAYTLDIVGSLLGIVIFTVLSFMWTPAWLWFGIVGVMLSILVWRETPQRRAITIASAVLATGVVYISDVEDGMDETIWSPYQHLSVQVDFKEEFGLVRANRIPHQELSAVEEFERGRDIPYEILDDAGIEVEKMLIIGAGTGTDVSEAISRGIAVTAVEIDPAIADIGMRYHPDNPYDDPNVELHINDGRAFMERTDETYDMILFALPDSLALYSSFSSVRLESFLFTREAIELAHDRLNPGGVLVMYNDYRKEIVIAKLVTLLEETFGVQPIYRAKDPRISALQILMVSERLTNVPSDQTFEPMSADVLPEDDWPFLYMESRTVPKIYWFLILGILALTGISVWLLSPKGTLKTMQWPFFFMGAAFLLLETKSIIQFSLLYGTTWLVNSLVFAGVLIMILLANLLVWKFDIRKMWPWYVGLAALLLANYLVPISSLSDLDAVTRYAGATGLLLAPIFMANVIFSGTFASSEESDTSFGWNILGTMVGGTVENFSLVMGYHNLAIVVAIFYALAFITDRVRRNRLEKE